MSTTTTLDTGTSAVAGAPTAVLARDVRRSFDGREVLRGIDLVLAEGEFVALLGRSGSGKSTFLRALAGLDDGATGEIRVPAARSVVFQDPRLLPWAKVIDNVILGRREADARERGLAALAEVGLADHSSAWPKTLSGGEAQRTALARALVSEPRLLLLDEPFGALDALTRIRMHTLVRELCDRHHPAVLLVTHDVDEAILLADRVLVLSDGAVSFDAQVGIPEPRQLQPERVARLRARLLRELGVDEIGTETNPDPNPGTETRP